MPADQPWSFEQFQKGETPLPSPNLGWNAYGQGIERVGLSIGFTWQKHSVEVGGASA